MNDFIDRHRNYLKYLISLSLLTFVILVVAEATHAAWYSGWQYRKKITIHSSRVSGGPHSNFPVLIKITSDTQLAAHAQDDGDDILFTSSGGTVKLFHQRESFTKSTGALVAWVRVDSISSSADPDIYIYMYYGNSGAGDQQSATGVWDSNYGGVWHLSETPDTNGYSEEILDSTSNGNDGNSQNMSSNDQVSGKILGSLDFDGSNDFISISRASSLEPSTAITVEAWVNWDNHLASSYGAVVNKPKYEDSEPYVSYSLEQEVSDPVFEFTINVNNTLRQTGRPTLGEDAWHHLVGTWSSGDYLRLYIDGVQASTSSSSYSGSITYYNMPTTIGVNQVSYQNNSMLDGIVDEVRISKIARSAQWIRTEYNNQVWPNTAVTPSPTPNNSPGGGFITVDSSYETEEGGGNQPPVADVGGPYSATVGIQVDLDGSGSYDPEDATVTAYSWSLTPPPGSSATLQNPTTVNPYFVPDVEGGPYVLQLLVQDSDGAWSEAASINITANAEGSVDVSGYSCNMKITIQGSEVQGGPHDDFPVLISLTDESLTTSGCGFVTSDDGDDILFTNSSQSEQLDHEIEKYDKDTGQLIAWVKVDLNAHGTDTEIYMYYGNSGVGDQQNPSGVWDSNYVAVLHLQDQTNLEDSTSYNNDGTAHGGVNDDTGKISGGQYFDGGSDYIEVQDNTSLDITTELTMEVWVSPTNAGTNQKVVGKTNSSYSSGYLIGVASSLYPEIWNSHGTDYTFQSGSVSSSPNWTHLATTWKTGGNMIGYVNGSAVRTISAGSYSIGTNSGDLIIGAAPWNPDTFEVTGIIDEVRISKTARSADWIKTEFNNQNDPGSFYVYEAQCPDSAPPISEFSCSIPITIDHDKVSGNSDLTNFPVLISLTNTSLKDTDNCGSVESPYGYDIIFTNAAQTTRLDYEIEKYDSASGKLVAWVRIPTLSWQNDTTIYVLFGHSGVCGSLENAAGVWNSDYAGVWHLKETDIDGGSGDIKDSTSHHHDGTTSGMNSSDQVEGRIDGSFDFDGSNDFISISRASSLEPSTAITLEAWLKWDNHTASQYGAVIHKAKDTDTSPYVSYSLEQNYTDQTIQGVVTVSNTSRTAGPVSLSEDAWHHLVATWSSGDRVRLYIDGSQAAQSDSTYTGTITYWNTPLGIGENVPIVGNTPIDGNIDEVRVSSTAHTADWIKTSYNNQSDPTSFYTVGASSCFLGGFSCNRKITIPSDHVSGSGNLTDFPVLIKIENDCNLRTSTNGGNVLSDGHDIVFTDASGATQLDHEIEEYDGGSGDLVAWVKIPTLSGSSDTDIYMYYGKSGLETCDPSNPAGVWSNDYRGVWHLQDENNLEDSTSYNNDGTAHGGVNDDTGKISGGQYFDGTSDYIEVNDAASLDITTELTMEAWVNLACYNQKVVGKTNSTYTRGYLLGIATDCTLYPEIWDSDGTHYAWNGYGTALSASEWGHVATTWTTDGNMIGYVNGSPVRTISVGNDDIGTNDGDLIIGAAPWNPDGFEVTGIIDEVRISSVARSAEWLATQYSNQSDPSSFVNMGEDSCGGQYGFNYEYCKKITVDHTQVDSDLSNFPLLVKITGDNDLKGVRNGGRVYDSRGWDIVFRDTNCLQLDHEIEKYDGDAGDLVAWVRVPTLSAGSDTEIFMYYGDSSTINCSPENPPGVWDSNYKGVWHLNESGTGTRYDSTSNGNNGNTSGYDGDEATSDGKIAGADYLDGTNDYIASASNIGISGDNRRTVTFWAKLDDTTRCALVEMGTNTCNGEFGISVRSSHYYLWGYCSGNDSSTDDTPATGSWHYHAIIHDGTYTKWYVDNTQIHSFTHDWSTTDNPVHIGHEADGTTHSYLAGTMDEVRISNTDRKVAWIKASYLNQSDPEHFYTISSCFEQTTRMTEGWEEEVQ